MFSEKLKNYAQEKYELRLPVMGKKRREIEEKMEQCAPEEQILMKFLYGTMPIRDTGEYGFEVLLGFVRHSLMVYQTMEWCRGIPEDMFVHHILYYRINSENIEDCRRFFYDQLIGRIQGMSPRDAVLEINYWCAENGTYEASDRRTIAPMTLYRSGKGRCGEESTFAVTAFRSVGIPARQVYTPRWAHCDSNHAWVEVYVDGGWHFLGACEPEEVLDKGWFTNASSRAMLIHTRNFSDYSCEDTEECLGQEELLFFYNDTSVYALTKNFEIRVVDEQQNPQAGAAVYVEILNGSEFSSIAELHTDEDGKASITLGLGDIRLHALKDGRSCQAMASVKDSDQAVLVLAAEGNILRDAWQDIDIEAPKDYPMHPAALTREQKEKNHARIREAARLREERIQSYYNARLASAYPEEEEILTLAAGNFEQIYRFLSKDDNPDRKALLHSLPVKDYKDAQADILESCLAGAAPYRKAWEEKGRLDLYTEYILCPRILFEELTDYRRAVLNHFEKGELDRFRENPPAIWEYIKTHMAFDKALDYSTICSTPGGSLALMQCNPQSAKILFAAVCRTLGIPARINKVDQEAEVWLDGAFVPVSKESGEDRMAAGTVILKAEDDSRWNYFQTWSIGKLSEGRYVTQNYYGVKFNGGRLSLSLEPGDYRLITTSRLPSGNQLASLYCFCLAADETREIAMRLRLGDLGDLLVSNQLEDFDVTVDGAGKTASSLTDGAMNIIAFLAEGQEPTEHVLNEMLEQQEILNRLDAQIWFVVNGEEALYNRTLKKVLQTIPAIRTACGKFDEIVEPLARRMYVDPEKLPLLIVTNPGLTGIYACSGYNAGSVDLMVKLLGYSQKKG